jgi:hypothetical protein
MPDFKKTEKIYADQGLSDKWKKPLEMLDDELFDAKVLNPDTNTYYQVVDLDVAHRKFSIEKKYPIREVLQIVRIKRVDGTEWLKSRGRIVGLDKAGNEVEHSFTDPEIYFRPLTRHEFKRKEPRNEYSPMERVCVDTPNTLLNSTKKTLINYMNKDHKNRHYPLHWQYMQKGQAISHEQ